MSEKQELEKERVSVAAMVHHHIAAANKTIGRARELGLNVTFYVHGMGPIPAFVESVAEIASVEISQTTIVYYPGE